MAINYVIARQSVISVKQSFCRFDYRKETLKITHSKLPKRGHNSWLRFVFCTFCQLFYDAQQGVMPVA